MKRLASLLVLCGVLLPASVVLAAPRQPPNILLLMAEDMSARVGAFGDTVAHTPNLDALARQGVRYPNTFTTAGVCAPSRAAHILAMHQISTGTQHMRTTRGPLGTYRAVPPSTAKAYPELLRAAGYYTYTGQKLDYQFSGTSAGSGPFTIWDAEGSDTHWRQRENGQPFFGFVSFMVTHESGIFRPLGSWPQSITHLLMQVLRAATAPDVATTTVVDPADVVLPPYYPDTPTVRRDVARHYTNIAVMDAQVGDILRQLEEDGLADNTIVIWTTDHGDGLPRAKRELFDSGIRVPMIIRWPEAYRPAGVAAGAVEQRLISFVDLGPTILRLAGVAVPQHMQGSDFIHAAPRQYVFAARDRIDEVQDRQRTVRDARYKYIRSWYPQQAGGHPLKFRDNIDMVREMRELYEAGELNEAQRQWFEPPGNERLFDLSVDPFEIDNLSERAEHRAVLNRMRAAMDDWLARVGDQSERSEQEMVASIQLHGEARITPAPQLSLRNGKVHIAAQDNASIGYRIDAADWQLYTVPFAAPAGATVAAKAVRYGWDESDLASLSVP